MGKKIGLILDSTCGLTKKEIEKKGFGFIPLIITINNKEYKSGIDINAKEVLKKMSDRNVIVKTSLPNGADILKAFNFVLKKFDRAIYIGMSSKFSGTNNAVRIASNDEKYKEKIFVYDSEYSSPWTSLYINEFESILKKYDNIEKIFSILQKPNPFMVGFLSPGDIWWFYKGGRISKIQYLIGSLIKIKPILKVADGEIKKDKISKIRSLEKAINMMCQLLEKTIENIKSKDLNFSFVMLKSDNEKLTNKIRESIVNYFKIKKENIIEMELSPEQSVHMGPNSFGMTILVPLKQLINKI